MKRILALLFAAVSLHAQNANVQADATTGLLWRPSTFFSNTTNAAAIASALGSTFQPLNSNLTSWASVTRASGFDTFVATPSSANLASLITNETGSGSLVFATSPTLTTPNIGAATGTSITGPTTIDLILQGGSSGASLVLGQGASGTSQFTGYAVLSKTAASGYGSFSGGITGATGSLLSIGYDTNADAGFIRSENTGVAWKPLRINGNPVALYANGTEYARLTSNGNLLIGTTSDMASLSGGLYLNGSGAGATASSTTTGTLRVVGGAGVTGAGYFGGNLNTAGTLTVSGTSTFAGPVSLNGAGNPIKGTTTNDNAATGYVGEYVSSTVGSGSAISLTTGTGTNITSISLTAGDWDVEGNIVFVPAATTVRARSSASISSTSATRANGEFQGIVNYGTADSSANAYAVTAPRQRFSVSATTTVYLVAFADFTTSTQTAYGQINARRVR